MWLVTIIIIIFTIRAVRIFILTRIETIIVVVVALIVTSIGSVTLIGILFTFAAVFNSSE
ncbi:MAG: hypothetical protein GQ577_09615 [Woeseiaceae bacterium]|nr:hypothetical protein [Woeseiaceae bacterium]